MKIKGLNHVSHTQWSSRVAGSRRDEQSDTRQRTADPIVHKTLLLVRAGSEDPNVDQTLSVRIKRRTSRTPPIR